MIKYGDYTATKDGKQITVQVQPPCISSNREYEYIYNSLIAYDKGKTTDKMQIVESETEIKIIYHR